MGSQCIACLLTGMGKDGAQGLLAARQAGAMTLAQNEASSVVFGMPGEAVRIGAARRVLSIEEFAPALIALSSNVKSGRAF
jgi:two-component system chemotaxis response regulator CheB